MNLRLYGAWLLIAQSTVFSNIRAYRFQLRCSASGSKGFPAMHPVIQCGLRCKAACLKTVIPRHNDHLCSAGFATSCPPLTKPLHVAMQIRLSHHPLTRGWALQAAWPYGFRLVVTPSPFGAWHGVVCWRVPPFSPSFTGTILLIPAVRRNRSMPNGIR